jgi:alpha-beta hydrolase superfamily lysophospholipase
LISDLAERLIKQGYLVAAIDYPNFGKSEGDKRGCIETFTSVAESSERFFYHIKKKYQNSKIYMLGYSLGGAVAFCLANKLNTKDLNGVILLSPAIR